MNEDRIFVFPSELGWMCASCRGEFLWELSFGHASPDQAFQGLRHSVGNPGEPDRLGRDIARRLQAYAATGKDQLDAIPVDVSFRTLFQQRIVAACRAIPAGETLTYAELARVAGHPGAARAVGQVMATNRVPLVIPCHRVVGSGGSLGGYSAPEGLTMKRRLLDLERQQAGSNASVVPVG